jgi:hypothetical protein
MIIKQIATASTRLFGNVNFNTMIMLSSQVYLDQALNLAKANGLSIPDISGCITILKESYKLDDIMIVKSEDKTIDNRSDKSITVSYFNLSTRQPLDKTKCQGMKLQLPVNLSPKDREDYLKFQNIGIDIYNSGHPAFRTKCFTFTDPSTDFDTTLDYRIKNYMRNRTECVNTGCSYSGMSLDGYVDCQCETGMQMKGFEIDRSDILTCAGSVRVDRVNIGFIVAFSLLGLWLILTLILVLCKKNISKHLRSIIYQDCVMFDRMSVPIDRYFIRGDLNKTIDEKKETHPPAEVNSSRGVQTRRGTTERLRINNNHNNNNSIENIEAIERTNCEIGNTRDLHTNVIVHNNFVETKQTTTNSNIHPVKEKRIQFNHEVTMADYESLYLSEQIIYDKRTFPKYLSDILVSRNQLASVFLKYSLVDPVHIRVTRLIFSYSLLFGINALFFTETYIDTLTTDQHKVK